VCDGCAGCACGVGTSMITAQPLPVPPFLLLTPSHRQALRRLGR
jgi:hypothetical protein